MQTTPTISRRRFLPLGGGLALLPAARAFADSDPPGLGDTRIEEAYEKAASQNVLAALNPRVFPGYFSVCADGKGFGYGNTYPSLDGHQLTDALIWLGRVDVAQANWDYVKSFQRPDGSLPLAILPSQAGKKIGPAGYRTEVASNGGLYRHWVLGNPLAALASPTYIQNADVIFRRTLDTAWLRSQIASVNLAAEFLAGLTSKDGAVGGSGYYVERPTRLGCDGVTQPHAVDAFRRTTALNRVTGDTTRAERYDELAGRVRGYFISRFWKRDHFAEYLHPERGLIDSHGLSDTNWAALAFGTLTPEQEAILWPKIRDEKRFYYRGIPTGIVTEPDAYESWEFTYPDRMDVAAMGRVWYLECQARARMRDADGLIASIRTVCQVGRDGGYYWRERYGLKGGYGAQKYCEYPANLIRVVQRFLLGVELRLDGTVELAPLAPASCWEHGFGQKLAWRDRVLEYRMHRDRVTGTYTGGSPQRFAVQFDSRRRALVTLPASTKTAHRFEIR
ncbi:MAG: hypothetical protein ACRD9L_05810 [Bryobacteraceae bacterium]